MTKRKTSFALVTVAALTIMCPAMACMHVPRTYKGTVTEKTKEALLFHDGVNAHLIIKTNLQASTGRLPDAVAWVIPLPSLPSHYEEADPALFKQMFQVVETANQRREEEAAKSGPQPAATRSVRLGLLFHPTQIVGNYQIQPIEIRDAENSGAELNLWLAANGYGRFPAEDQKPYLKPGAVFLALKLCGLRGGFTDVKPLHIVYKADTLSFPLKLSARSGVFDVELYVFTPGPLDGSLLGGSHLYADPSVPIAASADAPLLWQTTGGQSGYLTRFEGDNFNVPQRSVLALAADPTIDPRRNNAPAQADRPDQDSTHRLIGALLLLLLCAGVWLWKSASRAKRAGA